MSGAVSLADRHARLRHFRRRTWGVVFAFLLIRALAASGSPAPGLAGDVTVPPPNLNPLFQGAIR